MTADQSETTHLAFLMASSSIMSKGNFNSEVALNSLRIFQNTSEDENLSGAAEIVLEALANLVGLGVEDRRSRAWQDQKLIVQDAFRKLYACYSKNGVDPIDGDLALGNN